MQIRKDKQPDEKMRFLMDVYRSDEAAVKKEAKRLGVTIDQLYRACAAELARVGYPTQR